MPYPFIRVRQEGSSVKVEGDLSASVGTRVPAGDRSAGIFSEWSFADNELRAETDPFGFSGLYYAETSDGVVVSNSPIQLIAQGASPELDYEAIAIFFMVGFYIDDLTPFRSIKVVPGWLHWRRTGLTVGNHPFRAAATPGTMKEALSTYNRLFSQAVHRCVSEAQHPLMVPLSGGRDSRHILLEALRQGAPIQRCVTYASPIAGAMDPDAHVAKMVGEKLGVQHEFIKRPSSTFKARVLTHARAHLGTDEHAQMLSLDAYLRGHDCAIFDGIAGDSLSRNGRHGGFANRKLNDLIGAGQAEKVVASMISNLERIRGLTLQEVTAAMPALREFVPQARERLATFMSRFEDKADPFAHFMFWTRTRREISLAPGAVLSSARQVLTPYLDPDLAEMCLDLPYDFTSDGKFHDRAIKASFPDFDVPYQSAFVPSTPQSSVRDRLRSRLRMSVDGIRANAMVGPKATLNEAVRQIAMPVSSRRTRMYVWDTYVEALEAVSSKRGAAKYLARLSAPIAPPESLKAAPSAR